jgi:hypothetical protein|tara:strand:- start:40 stop:306 length:267 start_codon:yes stop_codon:yes gene_type:complete
MRGNKMSKYHAHLLRDGSNMSISGRTIQSVKNQVDDLNLLMQKEYGMNTRFDYSISKLSEDKKVWIKVDTVRYSKKQDSLKSITIKEY